MLFLVYGVGGIGKSEFVYQVIRELRARPAWRDVIPVLVDVGPGVTATRVIAQLLAAAGAAPEPRRGQATEREHVREQLAVLARLLDTRPFLLFVDDVHHLDSELVGEALHYLSRYVRRSRLFVASRREIQLAADAPPPVITTLGPLDAAAATHMMEALAERMQLPRADPSQVLRVTHGSPFHIRRMLVHHAPQQDSLEESLGDLAPAARRLLLAVALSQHRPLVDAMRETWTAAGIFDDQLRELEGRFLIDVDQGHMKVHDLIRDSLLGSLSDDERAAAHGDAAMLCVAQLSRDDVPSLMFAIDAATHYIAAGRFLESWRLVERWHSALGGAGCDHLLLDPLQRLRAELPAQQVAIDLLRARCLVRASLMAQASAVLAACSESRSEEEDTRHCLLAGEIAQRRGDLARAAELFGRAVDSAPGEATRFHARLQTASVAALDGDGTGARQLVADALAELSSPTASQRARCGWARTLSWMFDEQFERAAEEALETRKQLDGSGLGDLASRLAMLETLAAIECEQMGHARTAARQMDVAGLRQRVASFVRAIVMYADGKARAASEELLRAQEDLRAHGDTINAYIAGYYATAALADIGELGRARDAADQAAQLARAAGLRRLVARAMAQQALLAADALQSPVAHQLARETLALEHIGPRSRAIAHCAHAHAYTIEGDITQALDHVELARAAVAGDGLEAATVSIDVEHAAVELVAGKFDAAVARAERAVAQYKGRAGDYKLAHAQLVLAAAYVARARRTDLLFAERTVAEAQELADHGELRSIQVGCAILSASLARHRCRDRAADELLTEALRELDPERGSIYASTLLAAIEGREVARIVPGVVALLAHLGFTDSVERYLVDQHGRRAATDRDVARERGLRELFVDEVESIIVARHGEVEISGRSMQCALLSVLIQARGEAVSPEVLYKRVWAATEYHPLQHRNALYVAINRLRKSLRQALPDREVILRAATGWRLADSIDACVAVAAREEAK